MVSLIQILSWFKDGLFVNEEQFKKTWSSFWHKSEKLPQTQVLGLNDTLREKADASRVQNIESKIPLLATKQDLASVMAGLNPMGDATDLNDLETKPKRHNDSYHVLDQLDENNDPYIFRYDSELDTWINTKQVVYKDVAKAGGSDKTLQELDDDSVLSIKVNEVVSDVAIRSTQYRTRNLIDLTKVKWGYYNETGTINPSKTYCHTEFIPVEQGKQYTLTRAGNQRVKGFYSTFDSSKKWIKTYTTISGEAISLFTPSANEVYIVLTLHYSDVISPSTECIMIEGTDFPNSYIPYTELIVAPDKIKGAINVASELNTSFFKQGENIVQNISLTWNVGQIYSQTDGVTLSSLVGYDSSNEFVQVRSGQVLANPYGTFVYFYDTNKAYIDSSQRRGSNSVITIPSNCVYIRFLKPSEIDTPVLYYGMKKNNLGVAGVVGGSKELQLEAMPAIPLYKLSGVVSSENMFDKTKIEKGYQLTNGLWSGTAEYYMSYFIPIVENEYYTLCQTSNNLAQLYNGHFAFYDADRVLIDYWSTMNTGYDKRPKVCFQAPKGVSYIRFVIPTTNGDLSNADRLMFLRGRRIPKEYIPYKEIVDGSINDIYETTINKFDKSKASLSGYWSKDGKTWNISTIYNCTDFIPLKQGQTYCIQGDTGTYGAGFVYLYDKDFNIVKIHITESNPIDKKYTPAENEAYMVCVVPTSLFDSLMIVESDVYPAQYIPYKQTIKKALLPDNIGVGSVTYTDIAQGAYSMGAVDFQIPTTDLVDLAEYGQSLSTGQQAYPSLTTDNYRGNKMIGDQVWLNYGNSGQNILTDLVSKRAISTLTRPKARNGQSQDEPSIIAFANASKLMCDRMMMSNNSVFVANSTGTDGKTIEQLLSDAYYNIFKNKLIKLKSIADADGKSVSCPIIVFVQGEYNYLGESGGTANKEEYKALSLQLKNKMQNDVITTYSQQSVPLFMTYQTGSGYTRGNDVAIGQAQLEFALENPDVVIVCPTYNFTDRGGHLDANGYRQMGEQFAKAWNKTLRGEKFLPLYPIEAKKENNMQIRVTFHVPVPPLKFDTQTVRAITNNGFYVWNETGEIAIQSTEIQGESVLITLNRELSGNVKVSYAPQSRSGRGNLRDSDKTHSMYNYIDLDGKDENDNYIFDRDADETTLRPSFEPKDDKGNVIYNKPYPLYNFCLAFCLEIV